jgi:tellurite resistance protein
MQNAEIYQQMEIKKLDRRHEELRLEAMRVKERLKDNEDKRIEMNRQMNRPGQNIDRMA